MPEDTPQTSEGQAPLEAPSPELQQKIAIDRALKEILANPQMQADFRTAGFYHREGFTLATGRSNMGWDRGWVERATLYTDAQLVLGAGPDFVDAGIFQLLPAEAVRQELVRTKQEHFDRVLSDPQYRRLFVNDYAWSDPQSMGRQYYDNSANRPSMDNFPSIPPQLLDSEGRTFIDSRDGTTLYDHPKYNELLGKKTADEVKGAVTEELDRQKQFNWWKETEPQANPPTQGNP